MQTVTQLQKHKLGVLHSVEVGQMLGPVKMPNNPEPELALEQTAQLTQSLEALFAKDVCSKITKALVYAII
jgi:hypothetical protein